MAWRVEISKTAEKQIAKLDRQVQTRIIAFLRGRILASQNPRALGKALSGEKQGLWRFRVGNYRLICDLRDHSETIVLLALGHRKEIYR